MLMRKSYVPRVVGRALQWMADLPRSLWAAVGLFVGVAISSGVAVATIVTPNPVKSGFTSLQTDLVTYLGYAAVLVVAIAGIAIGLTMLVHWARRAASA